MSQTMTDERTSVVTEAPVATSNDKNNSAHIVLERGEDETAHAHVMRARIEGFPVTALCGHIWVPNRKATGLPVCSECKDIFEHDPNGFGDRGELPDE